MKTNKLTYSTPIPKVKEYVRNIVSRHNAGVQYPSSLNEVSRLFFKDEKEAKAFIKEWFTEGKDYIISGRKVSLSAKCLRRLFDMASVGLTPNPLVVPLTDESVLVAENLVIVLLNVLHRFSNLAPEVSQANMKVFICLDTPLRFLLGQFKHFPFLYQPLKL